MISASELRRLVHRAGLSDDLEVHVAQGRVVRLTPQALPLSHPPAFFSSSPTEDNAPSAAQPHLSSSSDNTTSDPGENSNNEENEELRDLEASINSLQMAPLEPDATTNKHDLTSSDGEDSQPIRKMTRKAYARYTSEDDEDDEIGEDPEDDDDEPTYTPTMTQEAIATQLQSDPETVETYKYVRNIVWSAVTNLYNSQPNHPIFQRFEKNKLQMPYKVKKIPKHGAAIDWEHKINQMASGVARHTGDVMHRMYTNLNLKYTNVLIY